MPIYEFKCACGKVVDRLLKLVDYDAPQVCECGRIMVKQFSAPAVRGDFAPYKCPITGTLIEGRVAHRENLARHGCRVLEAGEVETARKASVDLDRKLDKSVEETVEAFVANLPTRKAEQLAAEIQSGLTAETVRL